MIDIKSCPVKKLPVNTLTSRAGTRAGVVLYTIHEQKLCFIFGEDAESKEYTDFGGGVKKTDKSVITAALRELIEETLGVFGLIKEENVQEYLCCFDDTMFLLFVPISLPVNSKEVFDEFETRLKFVKNPEVTKLLLMEHTKLEALIKADNNSLFEIFFERTFLFLKSFNLQDLIKKRNSGTFSFNFPNELNKSSEIYNQ